MTKNKRMWLALFIFNLWGAGFMDEPLIATFNLICAVLAGLFFVFTEK